MLCRVALVRADVLAERITPSFERTSEPVTLEVTINEGRCEESASLASDS
jgi:hypothetical protein